MKEVEQYGCAGNKPRPFGTLLLRYIFDLKFLIYRLRNMMMVLYGLLRLRGLVTDPYIEFLQRAIVRLPCLSICVEHVRYELLMLKF